MRLRRKGAGESKVSRGMRGATLAVGFSILYLIYVVLLSIQRSCSSISVIAGE